MSRKSVVFVSVITSLIISFLIIGGIGYYVYNKYFKADRIEELISDYIEDYVERGDLKDLIVTKLEAYTGGKVTIDEISIDDKYGLSFKDIKIVKGNDTIFIRGGNATIKDGIVLNEIVRTGESEADKIVISGAHIDLSNITLNELSVNTSSEITIKNPKVNVEKIVLGYKALDFFNGKFLITGVTVLSPEVSLIRRENGIWLIMDTLKQLTDDFNLEYTDLLSDGIVLKNGSLHYLDKDLFPGGVMDVSGIDMVIKPFSGSLENLEISGVIRDNMLGNYYMDGEMDLNTPKLNMKLKGKDIEITERFVRAMPVIGENIWRTYKPTGKLGMDCLLNFDNGNGKREFDRQVNVSFNDMKFIYDKWPVMISRAAGNFMLTNNKINFKNVVGYLFQDGQNGTKIKCDAIMEIGKQAKKIIVKADDIDVTKELVEKMPDACKNLFDTLKPSGRADMDLIYSVSDNGSINRDYKIELNCKGWELTYPDVPLPLKDINGQVVISNRAKKSKIGENIGIVQIKDINGYFNDGQQITAFNFNGEFDMESPKKLFYVKVPGLNLSKDIFSKLPGSYKNITKDFTPNGQVDLDFVYDYRDLDSKPDISATLDCKGCDFEDSKLPIPLQGVMGVAKVKGNKIFADNIIGKSYDGQVKGSAELEVGGSSYGYNGEFSFSEINMEGLFRDFFKIDQKWQGLLNGKIRFNRGGHDQGKIFAKGSISLKEGNISDVPVALSIINIFNFGLPTKVVFERGYVNFLIKDDIIVIDEAKAYSDSIELAARGKVSFDGNLDINVIVGFSKSTLRDIPVVGPLVDFVVGGVRKRLTKVHLGGTIANPKSNLTMLEPIKGQIKNVIDLIPTNGEKHGTTTVVPGE